MCDVRFSVSRPWFRRTMRIGPRKLLRMGLIFRRVRGEQALDISLIGGLKLRRQMAAAGKERVFSNVAVSGGE